MFGVTSGGILYTLLSLSNKGSFYTMHTSKCLYTYIQNICPLKWESLCLGTHYSMNPSDISI